MGDEGGERGREGGGGEREREKRTSITNCVGKPACRGANGAGQASKKTFVSFLSRSLTLKGGGVGGRNKERGD